MLGLGSEATDAANASAQAPGAAAAPSGSAGGSAPAPAANSDPDPAAAAAATPRGALATAAAHACGTALGIPQVALMFLTKGPLPHAALWAAWLGQAAGLLPADCAAASACSAAAAPGARRKALEGLLRSCVQGGSALVERQQLFSVYVHVPPGAELEDATGLFTPYVIEQRVATSWGSFSLAQAVKNMLAAALEEPRNQRFLLLSESCAPLYPPAVVYQQAMYTSKSKINSCTGDPDWPLDTYRFERPMGPMTAGRLTKDMWRKSHQWMGLVRKHAQTAVDDVEIARAFEEHCWNGYDPRGPDGWRSCYSDEHYFPTLLAINGMEQETDCAGRLTSTDWCHTPDGERCRGAASLHPREYFAQDISPALLQRLRAPAGRACDPAAALASAVGGFTNAAALAAGSNCTGGLPQPALLGPHCPLFARKFANDSAPHTLQALLGLLTREQVDIMRAHAAGAGRYSEGGPGRMMKREARRMR
ncbi:hypothetical protein WJX81_000030 [Elliptochloris bilobata]|uniref:Uncharacterized protein n=1 Tax=Elliptochloris bilobata TaxID=381761 RepID=A0AAW1SFG1_9CHLO